MKEIVINGKTFPAPDEGLDIVITSITDSTRNANGKVVAQKVCRDNYKIDGLQWYVLDAEIWSALLKEFDNFFFEVTIPDPVNNTMRTLTMYPGDRSCQPIDIGADGMPRRYKKCKCNIIDVGA